MNKMYIFKSALASIILGQFNAVIASEVIAPGEYYTENQEGPPWGVQGSLIIKRTKNGNLKFQIDTVGHNGSQCGVEGILKGGRAELESMGKEKCTVDFSNENGDVLVSSDASQACSYYCGAGAYYDLKYLRAATGCGGAEIEAELNKFKRLYDKKSYAAAYYVLQPLLLRCGKTLDRRQYLNDLAITQYHMENYSGCLKTLKPLEADARRTDEQMKEYYPTSVEDYWPEVAIATRTNLKLCTDKLNGKRK